VVGLLADRNGFPLEIGCYEGGKAEKRTIVPVVRQFQERHQIEGMVVVADAGMLSAGNLDDLDDAGPGFIVGSRVSKAPAGLESHFRWNGDAFTDGQVIDTVTPKKGKNKENDPALRAEPSWGRKEHPKSWRAVWSFSAKRFARDNRTLTAQENRARDVISGAKSARTPRFARNADGKHALDEAALARARKLAGLKGYVTNLPVSVMSPGEVISRYHDLWHAGQSFRMSKTDLAARPMSVRRKDAIEAHLTIVFTALAVAREAQDRTGLAIRNVIRQLRRCARRSSRPAAPSRPSRPPSALASRRSSTASGTGGIPAVPGEKPPGRRGPRLSCCRFLVSAAAACVDAVGADAGQGRPGARPGSSRRMTKDHGYRRRVVLDRVSASSLKCTRLPTSLVDRYRQSGRTANLRH